MPEHKLSPENYYDNYGGLDIDLGFAYERIKEMGLPEELLASIREKKEFKFLILGSATTRNLDHVSKIDQYLRPGKVERDSVTIIDQNMYPLSGHHKEIVGIEGRGTDMWSNTPKSTPEFPYPKFRVAQADMRQLPFAEGSFDAIISDYTLNYLDSVQDIDKTFASMSQALSSGGIAVISVKGNQRYPYGAVIGAEIPKDDVQKVRAGGIEVHCFPLQSYIDSAARHDLKVVSSNLNGDDLCAVLTKEKSVGRAASGSLE